MSQKNHLFVYQKTDLSELESTLRTHEGTISYVKIASSHADLVDIERVCSIVRGSAVSVCIGGGIAENESERQFSRLQRIMGDDKRVFKDLARKGVTAVELPVSVLDSKAMTDLVSDFFPKKLVEVGDKWDCFHPVNSPSAMQEGIKKAQEFGADHIVLEGSFDGNCGIYHRNTLPNILLVSQLMELFSDKTRCIIEGPSRQSQDIWRSIFGPDTHIGNIHDFNQINVPIQIDFPSGYWDSFQMFRDKIRAIAEAGGLSWDNIARNARLNMDIINIFPNLLAYDDAELEQYLKQISQRNSGMPTGMFPLPLGLLLQLMTGGIYINSRDSEE